MTRHTLPVLTCHDCGVCCEGQEALPVGYWLAMRNDMPKVYARLPQAMREELEALEAKFDAEGWPGNGQWCVWYDPKTKGCKHHEHRPDICREFKIGGDDCHRRRREGGKEPREVYRVVGGRMRKFKVTT